MLSDMRRARILAALLAEAARLNASGSLQALAWRNRLFASRRK
jgi:hypothetical protein